MPRYVKLLKFDGLQGPAWLNRDHIYSIGIPLKDNVPIVGMSVIHTPTGPFFVKGSPDDIVEQINGVLVKEN